MKKALIITFSPHFEIGGIETYNRFLIELLLEKEFFVEEYVINLNFKDKYNPHSSNEKYKNFKTTYLNTKLKRKKKTGSFFWMIDTFKFWRKSSRELNQKIKKENYDLIIDSRFWHHRKTNKKVDFLNNKTYVFVQHFNPSFFENYNSPKIFKWLFSLTYFFSPKKANLIYKGKNVVLFDEENYRNLNLKKISKDTNYIFIPIARYSRKEIESFHKDWNKRTIEFLFAGRIINTQKNVKFLFKSSKYLKKKISVVGTGPLAKNIVKWKNIEYLGAKKSEDLKEIYLNSKYLLITSKYEGFPIVIVEALSFGVIPIIFNTFPSSKFLSKSGFLIDKKISAKKYAEFLNNIILKNNSHLSEKSKNFAKEYLNSEKFKERWEKLIEISLSENQ